VETCDYECPVRRWHHQEPGKKFEVKHHNEGFEIVILDQKKDLFVLNWEFSRHSGVALIRGFNILCC
jgi:hypothetical protein